MIGAGPFKLEKYTPKVGASFVRNADYWGCAVGPGRSEISFFDNYQPQIGIAVMYLGRIMEWGPAERVFDGPHHPYAEALLSSAPSLDGHKARVKLEGEIPSAANPPPGCVFHTRCPRKIGPICDTQVPDPWEESPGHHIRCHLGRESLPGAMSALPVGHRSVD